MGIGRPRLSDEHWIANFWATVNVQGPNDCWEWTRRLYFGYGHYSVLGRLGLSPTSEKTHRLAFMLTYGCTLPGSVQVCHRCDNRACCNPDHLFLGTVQDNMADKVMKKRQARGETNGRCKLTEDSVRRIRKLLATGEIQTNLAARFGVSQTIISLIARGETWKHIA